MPNIPLPKISPSAHFIPVNGHAAPTWFLFINGYYSGKMIIKTDGEWFFSSQDGSYGEHGEYFKQEILASNPTIH